MKERTYSTLAMVFSGIAVASGVVYIYQLNENLSLQQREFELLKIEKEKRELEREELRKKLNTALAQHAEVAEKILVEAQAHQKDNPATVELQEAARALQQVGFFSASLSLREQIDAAEQSVANFRKADEAQQASQNNSQQLCTQ